MLTPREDFLVSAFQDDPRLVEMFREAESKRRWYHRIDWFKLLVWAACLGYCWLFWYGVAKAL